jgi:hypothetical protein
MTHKTIRFLLAATGALGTSSVLLTSVARGAEGAVSPTLLWTQTLSDAGGPVALSSPDVANLAGGPAVVVGDRSGHVYAFNLSSGSAVPGWPFSTSGVPVDSTPSVDPDNDSILVGVGNSATPSDGGYQAITSGGVNQWYVKVQNPPTDEAPAYAVQASMAVGDLQGQTDTVSGSLGEAEDAINAGNGSVLPGYPWFQADSDYSTPALADIYSNGSNEIVEGGDSSSGLAYNTQYSNGGHIRILAATGNGGTGNPGGGLDCEYDTNQVVQSSPAVGEFLSGQAVGIVVGTGTHYAGTSNTDQLLAVNTQCQLQWSATLNGATNSSPALADVLGNGQLQVVEGTDTGSTGSVYVINGATGQTIWSQPAIGRVIGSVVTTDLTGAGHQDVIAATTNGVEMFDGQSGNVLGTFDQNGIGFQNSPLVTDDPNGTIGITVAGYNGNNTGVVQHYEVPGSSGSLVKEAGAWPMFHHDPQLTGDAGTPPATAQAPCTPPTSAPAGYWLAGSDGGIFTFGDLPFCGSTGAISLAQPIVGLAPTPNGGGYWMVGADGGVFSFGDAPYYGSVPGVGVHVTNIVGIAPTPDGRGYWIVGSDGGMFSFGDAKYYGSVPGLGIHVTNIRGVASATNGGGYWMVGSDGGVFSFGDAPYHGSVPGVGVHVTNIVGLATDSSSGGYWIVGDDGGVYSFDAPFDGSVPGLGIHIANIVGMEAVAGGSGYRMVGSDGGVFCFGNAPYYGSMGGKPLARPIIGIAGF